MAERRRCQASVECYSRVTGFYRPVQGWNPGKQAEFQARRGYRLSGGDCDDGLAWVFEAREVERAQRHR